jgi:hypothetical protein
MSDIQMFDSRGNFLYPDPSAIAALSPSERERFSAIEAAWNESAAVAKDLADATERVQNDVIAIAEVEAHIGTLPRQSFLQLHRETFSGPNARHPGKYKQ